MVHSGVCVCVYMYSISLSLSPLLRHHFKEAGKTKFSRVIQLNHAPISKPAKNVSKPKQLDKRARDNREMVLNLIFSSFKTHEFYTFKDLVHKTSQPPVSVTYTMPSHGTYLTCVRSHVLFALFSSLPPNTLLHSLISLQTYLKEILREVCLYNTRAPHKNMWQLKPEYRHYKKKDPT